jgi:hypothetical protein
MPLPPRARKAVGHRGHDGCIQAAREQAAKWHVGHGLLPDDPLEMARTVLIVVSSESSCSSASSFQ